MDTTSYPDITTNYGQALACILREAGFPVHRIGALFDVNQGRISEVIGTRRPVVTATE